VYQYIMATKRVSKNEIVKGERAVRD